MAFVFALRTSNHRARRAGWTVDRGAPLRETCARKQPDPEQTPECRSGPQSVGPTWICLNEIKHSLHQALSLSICESVTLESLLTALQTNVQATDMHNCFETGTYPWTCDERQPPAGVAMYRRSNIISYLYSATLTTERHLAFYYLLPQRIMPRQDTQNEAVIAQY
jgi:hypothetical protein